MFSYVHRHFFENLGSWIFFVPDHNMPPYNGRLAEGQERKVVDTNFFKEMLQLLESVSCTRKENVKLP